MNKLNITDGYLRSVWDLKNETLKFIQMENKSTNVETGTTAQTNANTVLAAVRQFKAIDDQVRDYIYPKLYRLYNEKKLNKGHLPPHRPAKESVSIREFNSDGEKISVLIDIWWGGDCYDYDYVTLTCDEWDAIENCR